jgi:hypothetical protein
MISGRVAPGFEEVRCKFERNFADRRELGGAVAALSLPGRKQSARPWAQFPNWHNM